MIAKKIPNTKKSSNKAGRIAGLAEYITEPELTNKQEKCIYSEAKNFLGDDLETQTLEMIALSQEAVKSKDPIDHWVLSWKSNERPTPEQASEAAAIFIKQCGLQGHQYIIGLHDDTENMHLHIAVNRVHPEILKVVKINKGFDREASQQAIAIIEKTQGWSVEKNARYRTNDRAELIIDPTTKRPKIFAPGEKLQQPSTKAQAMEIQTGEKSAQRIGIENAPAIIASATSWADLHAKMQAAGMEYQRQGSGAVIKVGDTMVKASDVVDRKNNFGALQKRFGLYQPANQTEIKNDPHGRTNIITDERFSTGFEQPDTQPARFKTFDNLRHLPRSNMAGRQQNEAEAKDTDLLQLNESADRGRFDRVRWRSDSNSAKTSERGRSNDAIREKLDARQDGWNEYIAIRDDQKSAKSKETIELQKRHGEERSALSKKQKSERDNLFSGNWTGKGDLKNALKSITATQQAAEKLELQERQREERKALQAKYKPLPMYKQWREQPQIVGLTVRPVIDQDAERQKQITVARTLRLLTHRLDSRQHITYQLDRKDVFRDEGRTIAVLDLNSDRGIAAALATAQQKFGQTLELTGSEAFKRNAVAVAVANNLTCKFTDPALEKLRDQLQQQKYQAQRDADLIERQRAAAVRAERERLAAQALAERKAAEAAAQAQLLAQAERERVAAAKQLEIEKAKLVQEKAAAQEVKKDVTPPVREVLDRIKEDMEPLKPRQRVPRRGPGKGGGIGF